ncbi:MULTISPECIES: hypothetical protein [Salinivibrio]|uniref:DUF3347 domain-containing protein n=1 Tax=Salinivibrio siamensis TaxID=414286 RepID=A0ABX3K8L0_9GAMM|nr:MULTISPECIES: hypothetical protein [Salinivibrio]KKA45994.1 hypothetical protein WN56_02460 [Salinivibrio sp. KP-1]MPX98199.1 hypothetical protein [Salinivibrio sp. VYel6]OOE77108.1 hypothetical protein BZG23_01915 [Salinivibrio sp. ML290]OOE78917.1 hypothetical protein BZG72_14650 [Salinivibrio sp. PR6]OOE84597.1 hypothetical protein BZG73_10030 [Salinivibrio siamensis]
MKIAIFVLIILLVGTNAFWFYQALDSGITAAYRDDSIDKLQETQAQLMAAIPKLAASQEKAEIVAAFESVTDQETYEKEGCTWVGWVGLKFGDDDRLLAVSPSWSYQQGVPCFDN